MCYRQAVYEDIRLYKKLFLYILLELTRTKNREYDQEIYLNAKETFSKMVVPSFS